MIHTVIIVVLVLVDLYLCRRNNILTIQIIEHKKLQLGSIDYLRDRNQRYVVPSLDEIPTKQRYWIQRWRWIEQFYNWVIGYCKYNPVNGTITWV